MNGPTNYDRAVWADAAVEAFRQACDMFDEDAETELSDLLSDLMHWCDAQESRVSFDACVERARANYDEERAEEADDDDGVDR